MADPYGRDKPPAVDLPRGRTAPATPRRSPVPSYVRMIPINTRSVEAELQGLIAREAPRLSRILVNTWNAQADALKYQEIANALALGEITPEMLAVFQESYAEFVNQSMVPRWTEAFGTGFRNIVGGLTAISGERVAFGAYAEILADWTATRGAEMVTNLTNQQATALRQMIGYYTQVEPMNPRAFARFLRPAVGLDVRQVRAVENYRRALMDEGFRGADLERRVAIYAGRQNRIRADRIARTEFAYAHNFGQYHSVLAAADAGHIDVTRTTKRWLTAQDERVCNVCGGLGGWTLESSTLMYSEENQAVINLNDTFPTNSGVGQYVPPAHPNCRCTIIYETETVERVSTDAPTPGPEPVFQEGL